MDHKKYRVKFRGDDGEVIFRGFDAMKQAQNLYDSLDGKAEIQKYNDYLRCYESTVYPTFEY